MTGAGKVVSIAPGGGAAFRAGPDRFTVKGTARERSAAFSVVEYTGAPHVPGPPRHVHRTFDEGWYLLEGAVEFTTPTGPIRAAPGAYLFVPRGVAHTFRVVGDGPARWIGIFSPGRYVGLIEELGQVLPEAGPPNPKKLTALFHRYDTDFV